MPSQADYPFPWQRDDAPDPRRHLNLVRGGATQSNAVDGLQSDLLGPSPRPATSAPTAPLRRDPARPPGRKNWLGPNVSSFGGGRCVIPPPMGRTPKMSLRAYTGSHRCVLVNYSFAESDGLQRNANLALQRARSRRAPEKRRGSQTLIHARVRMVVGGSPPPTRAGRTYEFPADKPSLTSKRTELWTLECAALFTCRGAGGICSANSGHRKPARRTQCGAPHNCHNLHGEHKVCFCSYQPNIPKHQTEQAKYTGTRNGSSRGQ